MFLKIGLGVAALYCLLVVAGYLGQQKLLYVIDATHVTPAAAGLAGVTEWSIPAPDGNRVLAWYAEAQPGQPTLLYFHGNGGALASRVPRIKRFMAEGWGVLMMTYRGYGGSTGSPDEADNVADAIRAFDTLAAHGVRARDIVLYGESLGTGVAAQVAMVRRAAGLILEAPYTSIPDVGKERFWFMPVYQIMRDRYETIRIIGRLKLPKLILHGTRDAVVPVEMGRTLAGLAPQPVTFVEFPKGGHDDLYTNGNDALDVVRIFISRLPR